MAREVEASALCNKWAEGRCRGRAKLAAPDLLICSLAAADGHRDALKSLVIDPLLSYPPINMLSQIRLLWRSCGVAAPPQTV